MARPGPNAGAGASEAAVNRREGAPKGPPRAVLGTPDDPAVWRELVAAGVDLLNADDLPGLERFLRSQNPGER